MAYGIRVKGVKCDNSSCNYKDDTYVAEGGSEIYHYLKYYTGRPCPECGENLMTKFHGAKIILIMLLLDLFKMSVLLLILYLLYKLIF